MSDPARLPFWRSNKVQRILYPLVALLAVVFIGTPIALAWGFVNLSRLADQTKQSTQILVDCTTPGHNCYEKGRDANSGAIGTINQVTVLAVACAKVSANVTIADIQICVQKGLKK